MSLRSSSKLALMPPSLDLTKWQGIQRTVALTGQAHIEREALCEIMQGLAAWNRQLRKALWRFGSRFVAIGITVISTMLVGSPLIACSLALVAWIAIATLPKYRKDADRVQWFWRMVHGTVAICLYAVMTAAR
jgi:hypothetical protein